MYCISYCMFVLIVCVFFLFFFNILYIINLSHVVVEFMSHLRQSNCTFLLVDYDDMMARYTACISPASSVFFVLMFWVSSFPVGVDGGRILMMPYAVGYNSRFGDMIKMAKLCLQHGHDVTVLINSGDQTHMSHINGSINYLQFPYPPGMIKAGDQQVAQYLMAKGTSFLDLVRLMVDVHVKICETIFNDTALLNQLEHGDFDVFISDGHDDCSRLIQSYLDLPAITYNSNGPVADSSFFPDITAITPFAMSTFSDEMSFQERVMNFLGSMVISYLVLPIPLSARDDFVSRYHLEHKLKRPLEHTFAQSLVLVGADFTFEYPRPYMPNVVPIGGWYVDPPNALPDHIEEFVQRKSKGTIYVSFGTLFALVEHSRLVMMAKVFAELPYNIIWRHDGEHLEVADNILLLKWAPQNDILGHPKTVLFITHCGSHGAYETLYHGVPIVAVPLFADQHANSQKLINRLKLGIELDFKTMERDDLQNSINAVLGSDAYRSNAALASRLFRDQQTTPTSRLLFWTEYTMRHQGTPLLWSKAVPKLNVLQMCSVDVILFLSAVVITFCVIVFVIIRYIAQIILQRCRKQKQQ